MKNAYLRVLTIGVLIAFAPLALASAQTDISVSDHSWIKGQQDALAAMKEDLQGHPATDWSVLPQRQQDLISRLQGDIAAQTNAMGKRHVPGYLLCEPRYSARRSAVHAEGCPSFQHTANVAWTGQ